MRGFRILLIIIFSLSVFDNVYSQTQQSLDRFVIDAMNNHYMQGLSAVIVKDGKIAWAKGYGYANVEKNIPFTPNTVNAEIASLSKTITATAIMQLWERKLFQLDDPINDYLPFTVSNPYFPKTPITFKMLLTHTSSLFTDYDIGSEKFDFNNENFPKLGKYLYEILNPGGDYYIDTVCFHKCKPGTQWNYCGTGYALIGYLVELISKTPFDQYCNENIFSPLGMKNTSWHFRGVDTNAVSRPYHWSDEANGFVDCGLFEYPTYPEGQLKTSAIELSKFLAMIMNGGTYDGKKILQSSTLKLMQSNLVSISDTNFLNAFYGIGWGHIKLDHEDIWGHHGRDEGISTEMVFKPEKNTGIILFSNGEDDASALILCSNRDDIVCKLFDVADTINIQSSPELNNSYISFPCEHGKNYWKNNPGEWALNALPMKLGTRKYYDREQVLSLLEIKDTSNSIVVMAQQLIAAKLNVANGSELSPVVLTMNKANELIGGRSLPVRPAIPYDSKEGIQMIALSKILESYNRGSLNKENCKGNVNQKDDVQ